ncbi:MAG: hypothetical protein NVS9B15_04420 [Acidobacteriaceae bacterium]
MKTLAILLLAAVQVEAQAPTARVAPFQQGPAGIPIEVHALADTMPFDSHVCGTMRTYVLSKAPDHHIVRSMTCVPLQSDYLKHASAVRLVPVSRDKGTKPKLRY